MLKPSERNQEIFAMRQSGATLVEVGAKYAITRERVRQICFRIERWLGRKSGTEKVQQIINANEHVIIALRDKLDIITSQLDDIKREMDTLIPDSMLIDNCLELSTRASNCLHYAGIKTVSDLLRTSKDELLLLQNMGQVTVREIQNELRAKLGCELRERA